MRRDDTRHPQDGTPEPASADPADGRDETQVDAGSVERKPRPRLNRVGRGAVALAAVALMCVLLVLTLRYSRASLEATAGGRPEIPGPPPTEVEQIERYRPPREVAPEPEPELPAEALPAIRVPPMPGPSREVEAAMRSPLVVGRPPREGRMEAASSRREERDGLPSFDELQRQVFGERGYPAAPPAVAEAAEPTGRRNLLPSPGRASTAPLRVDPAPPASPFLLRAGTYVPAVMTHRVVSDQPGLLRAVVSRDVYDSLTGGHLLLPRGTVLLGHQDELPMLGQRRLAVLWSRLQLPDGTTLDLGGTGAAPSAGLDGAAGVTGRVRQHWGRRYGAAVLLSLVGAGSQLSQPQPEGDRLDPGQIAAGALGLELGQLSQEILRQYADLPPTIELQPGARLHVFLARDLAFRAPYRFQSGPFAQEVSR